MKVGQQLHFGLLEVDAHSHCVSNHYLRVALQGRKKGSDTKHRGQERTVYVLFL